MANPYIGFRCPQDVYDALENYLKVTGKEKTEYILELIRNNLNIKKDLNLAEKVEDLDLRVAKIERRLDAG
jgi:predicted DNA-binding protein